MLMGLVPYLTRVQRLGKAASSTLQLHSVMPTLDVAFLPSAANATDVGVVIDVLRMTTTAAVLFSQQLETLTVIGSTTEALALARTTNALLLGERQGVPLPGFDGGNSPLEYANTDLTGKQAILCTTNGSKAVEAVSDAKHLLLGAIVNARAVAERALARATDEIVLVCAGTEGNVSLDDLLGAGCIVREVMNFAPDIELTDAARIALLLADDPSGVPANLEEAKHTHTLRALGFAADVEFALQLNTLDAVPEKSAADPARFSISKR